MVPTQLVWNTLLQVYIVLTVVMPVRAGSPRSIANIWGKEEECTNIYSVRNSKDS